MFRANVNFFSGLLGLYPTLHIETIKKAFAIIEKEVSWVVKSTWVNNLHLVEDTSPTSRQNQPHRLSVRLLVRLQLSDLRSLPLTLDARFFAGNFYVQLHALETRRCISLVTRLRALARRVE